ncbi:hydroxymethylpyrimidine/phosphomethylpyrimidine kinase [Oxalobacteraceae bacterium GrIS 2.11]
MKPCVLVFAGSDPSGGAGIAADIEAIAAQGAHALPIITAITVQDNDRVFAVHPVTTQLILQQAQTLADKIKISAIKFGIIANRANAIALAQWVADYKTSHPDLPVILDPVLASGHGDLLSTENAIDALAPLLSVATLITPNLPEATMLCPDAQSSQQQARQLMQSGISDVLIKGGHGTEPIVTNYWYHQDQTESWQWPRLPGSFHGSGCTLASAIAGQLAHGVAMHDALTAAQRYCHRSLHHSYAIAVGQRIPGRTRPS